MKRLGYILASEELYIEQKDIFMELFKQFYPFTIQYNGVYHENPKTFKLVGECDSFDEIKEGDNIPKYDCITTISEDGGFYKFRFVKI